MRGWIGVEPRDLTAEIAQAFNLPVSEGVLITGVMLDSPAMKGGLKPGDVVLRVAGTPVRSTAELMTAVAALKPADEAVIGVQRGERALELRLTVAPRPPMGRPPR